MTEPGGQQDILQTIVASKRETVERRRREKPLTDIREAARHQSGTRGFVQAIAERVKNHQPAVIAEIKKASPSKGVIRENFDPVDIARRYESSGAACLSVLTDVEFFQGDDSYLDLARSAVSLPVLRKDFMIDPYQVYESRAIGADCILLIAAVLDIRDMHEMADVARELDLDVLIEVHNREELDKALTLAPALIGINNRNLKTFEVNLNITLDLLQHIPQETIVVTESGIGSQEDVARMLAKDVYGFLVGEAFMKEPDPGEALKLLFS